jgi:hypothetical protein
MDDLYTIDPIEAYCVRCRTSIEMEEPTAVWTRKGQPATRGVCPLCGGVVFRIGKTELHDERNRPSAVEIGDDGGKRVRTKLSRDTVYVNYAPDDEESAQQIAADLQKSGLAVWLHEPDSRTAWASGVHPALKECARMVVILSGSATNDVTVSKAWQFFKEQRKPIVLAQVSSSSVPDVLRRSPRFLMHESYKASLRQMLDALSS